MLTFDPFYAQICRVQETQLDTFAVTVKAAMTPAVANCKPLPVAVDFVESVISANAPLTDRRTIAHRSCGPQRHAFAPAAAMLDSTRHSHCQKCLN